MKQVLRKRGWTRNNIVNQQGQCCLFGAYVIAKSGKNGASPQEIYDAKKAMNGELFDTFGNIIDPTLQVLADSVYPDSKVKSNRVSTITEFNDYHARSVDQVNEVIDRAMENA